MSGNILKSGYVCFNSFRVQNEAQFLDNYGENMGLPHDKKVTGGGIENRKPLAEKGNTTGRRESCNKGRCVEKSTLFQYRRKIVADRGKKRLEAYARENKDAGLRHCTKNVLFTNSFTTQTTVISCIGWCVCGRYLFTRFTGRSCFRQNNVLKVLPLCVHQTFYRIYPTGSEEN